MSALPGNIEEFRQTLDEKSPKSQWSASLIAMWWDCKGDWENAHNIAQDISSETGNWIHAYLHRKEGDRFNAGYWYGRASKSYPVLSLQEEQQLLVEHILRKEQNH